MDEYKNAIIEAGEYIRDTDDVPTSVLESLANYAAAELQDRYYRDREEFVPCVDYPLDFEDDLG